jgi:hypothetical protein
MATLTLNQPGEYRYGDFPALYTAIGSDGQKYFYATKEYINRGYVDNGQQHYPLFAIQHPKVFESASLVKLPSTEGLGEKAKQVYSSPTEGYLWKQSDLIKATNGVISQPFYQITADRPAIQGMVDFQGQPTYAVGATPNSDASFMTGDEKIINYRAATQSSGGNFLSNFVNNLVGGDIGKAFASIDPSAAISKAATNLFNPIAQAATDLFQPVEKAASQALSDFDKTVGISAVSREATQFAKDIGLTGAVKEVSDVVHGIGKAAEKDPLQYAAIVACIAAAPFTNGASLKIIPYIQATAKVTSKDTSVEDMIKEGAKAYVISSASAAAGDYVAGDPVTGDITGGYVPATGVTGATGSMAVGKAAGNISANIVANAAKGGKQTVGEIVAAGVSDAGLAYLAQTYTPDWTSLTPKQQAAAIDGVKLVLGDKSAASKLVNDALSTSIQAASKAALTEGYDNPWQKQAAEEGGFQDAKTFKAADKLGITNIGEYDEAIKGGFASGDELREAKGYGIANRTDLMDLKSGGFDNLAQLNEAKQGGFTLKDDFVDANQLGIASLDQYNKYKDGAFTNVADFNDALAKGYSKKEEYDLAMAVGWKDKAEQTAANELDIETPEIYRQVLEDNSAKTEGYDSAAQRQAAEEGGFPNAATFKVADKAGFTNSAEFNAASNLGFNNATDYRGAVAAGIETPEEFALYKDSNYSDVLDYRNAAAKGFYTKAEFDDATAKGYSDKTTYDKAEDLGFRNANDYSIATANNIDAKTWNENNHLAVDDGWVNLAEKLKAEKLGFDDPEIWKYATAVDLENQGSDIVENYFASQVTEVGEDLYALPDNAGLYNANTGEVTDFYGNKLAKGLFEGIISNINEIKDNPFLNRPRPKPTTPTSPTSAADALSQAAQVIPDYLQDPSQIAKRKERGTPYSANPEWSVLNPQAPQNPQTQPQQKPQPLALPNPEVVQSGLFSGILSPYNPQNQQGGPYG